MEYKTIIVEYQESIAVLTMNRPQALNALNSDFFNDFNLFLDNLNNQPQIRVVIITGQGKAFVAGADIAEMVNKNTEQGYEFGNIGQRTFARLEQMPQIFIAAVNGFALGGGCELSMACDFRIASNLAKFGQPEVNLGLTPGYAGTQRLSRLIGLGNALYLLLTADTIDANEAYRMGLVQKVTEPEKLMEETLSIAKKITSKGPQSVKLVKEITRKGYTSSFEDGCKLELKAFASLFGNEGTEGMKAFLEKRKPNW